VSPTRIERGGTTTLSWNIPSVGDGITSCTITGNDGFSYEIPVASCTDATSGSTSSDPVEGQTTYTLTCGSETEAAAAVVDVAPHFNTF
jgi:hypothetical protein